MPKQHQKPFSYLILPALLLAICGHMRASGQAQQDFHYSYAFPAGGRLAFSNRNGSAEIVGWDRNEIDVSGTKSASNRDDLSQISIKVAVHGSTATVSAEFPEHNSWFGRSYGARFLIHVPHRTLLDQAQTTNGSISVEDLEGGGRIVSANGRISMARDNGDYEAHTSNATIEFQDCSGNLMAQTTNGAVRGRLKFGAADVHSTNGSVDVTLLNPPNGKPIRATTTNGGVTLAIAEYHGNPITAESTNGGVTARLPAGANAHIDAHTAVGSVNSDFTVNGSVSWSRHALSGDLGSGGPSIDLRTATGSIHIEKY